MPSGLWLWLSLRLAHERLRVEQALKLKNRPCEVRNAVFRVNLGYLPTHYSGARLALQWRSARLRDSLTPN